MEDFFYIFVCSYVMIWKACCVLCIICHVNAS